jgi:hypothetical protein
MLLAGDSPETPVNDFLGQTPSGPPLSLETCHVPDLESFGRRGM